MGARDGIITMTAPWIAAQYPLKRHPSTLDGTMAFDCGNCIGRTAGRIAASGRQNARWPQLPAPRDEDHQAGKRGVENGKHQAGFGAVDGVLTEALRLSGQLCWGGAMPLALSSNRFSALRKALPMSAESAA